MGHGDVGGGHVLGQMVGVIRPVCSLKVCWCDHHDVTGPL